MMDELRDYRFMLKICCIQAKRQSIIFGYNSLKIIFPESVFGLMKEICSIQKGLQHRPFNPNTESHQKFGMTLEEK